MSSVPERPRAPGEPPIREHVFDGIAEYDNRLPNWWLFTLYATIAFAIVYWLAYQHFPSRTPEQRVDDAMARVEAARLAGSDTVLDDETLWKMSRNPVFIASGRAVYTSTCASCHGPNREGGIGFALNDGTWVHGSKPTEIYHVIDKGVNAMPPWGGLIGARKVADVTAYLLSHMPPPEAAE